MLQKILASQASFERLGGETGQEQSLDRIEQAAPWTEPCYSKVVNARRLAWLGVKLCNSFLHRWFNLCDVGAEELLYALPMLHSFAGVDVDPMTAPQETATLHSRHLPGEHDFLSPANSRALSGNQSKFEVSWRTPWLYLVFLLLVWLLLF
jgi:hypothetical protein